MVSPCKIVKIVTRFYKVNLTIVVTLFSPLFQGTKYMGPLDCE